MSNFVVIDVETATSDRSSICQIGLAFFKDSAIVDTWETLVNPDLDEDEEFEFSWLHGISKSDVEDAPYFNEIYPELNKRLSRQVVISHTTFDKHAISQATDWSELAEVECTWLDSARLAKITNPEKYGKSGYNLKNLCKDYKIPLDNHHNAVCDAVAAGSLVVKFSEETDRNIQDWVTRTKKPIVPSKYTKVKRDGKSVIDDGNRREGDDGKEFSGKKIVFTGELSMPRRVFANMAASVGFAVVGSVSKKTSYLFWDGEISSGKTSRAEELGISMISEEEFVEMVRSVDRENIIG